MRVLPGSRTHRAQLGQQFVAVASQRRADGFRTLAGQHRRAIELQIEQRAADRGWQRRHSNITHIESHCPDRLESQVRALQRR